MNEGGNLEFGLALDDEAYQTILKASRAIAFMFDADHKYECVSPHIGELIDGNYNGRFLSQVMLEDGVIHPSDIEKSLKFRDLVMQKKAHEMVLRLKTPEGEYRWFRMVMSCHTNLDNNQLCVGMLFDIDDRMLYQEDLRRQAEFDPVTGIYHRLAFLQHFQELLGRPRTGAYFLLQFDIDRFKIVNELYGTDGGDNVLRYIGTVLKRLLRFGEIYGRMRDDLFCVCASGSREDALSLMKRIHHEIRRYNLAFRFFLPTGIVEIPPDCKDSPSSLCDKATLAQRSIKGNYLKEHCFYKPELGDRLNREHLIICEMEQALKEKQFEAWFQPQYDMRDGSIIGAEVLARWQHPKLGMISPAEFIPLFERNGFIIDLDEYIWEAVCRCLSDWRKAGLAPPPTSVNVSRVHLYDAEFSNKFVSLCARYELPHELLWLEITESAYIEQPQELFDVMKNMKQQGFQFAMDDFGSGYSSLNILKDIPVDLIKFDLRFLEGTNNNGQAGKIILKKSVQLIEDLGLTCLAEGVETPEQVEFLRDIGCNRAQGFYFARPMPHEKFGRILLERKEDGNV